MHQQEVWEQSLGGIAASLKNNKCVLLLGPEFPFLASGKSRAVHFRAFLKDKKYAGKIAIHEHEDLLSLKGMSHLEKLEFLDDMKMAYKELKPSEIYRKIVDLPFQTIISLSPDHILKQVFDEKNKENPGYYEAQQADYRVIKKVGAPGNNSMSQAVNNIPKPTPTSPVIFNLLGYAGEHESMPFDFDEFLNFIMQISKDNSLPENLRTEIQNASTFVFAGFQMDKWYFKLLLTILNIYPDDIHSTRARLGSDNDLGEKAVAIYRDHFGFTLLGKSPVEFVSALHQNCKSKGILRENCSPKSQLQQYDELFNKGDFEGLLDYLMLCLRQQQGQDLYDVLSQAKGRVILTKLQNQAGLNDLYIQLLPIFDTYRKMLKP